MSAAQLCAETEDKGALTPSEDEGDNVPDNNDGVQYEVVAEDGEVIMRTNREIIDDSTSQKLTMEDIETLKENETSSGKDLIAKILESHSALDQKTAFALAKYTLRKTKKYLRRFTLLPLDVPLLTRWMLLEKEPAKILELREETLALIASWSNVHHGGAAQYCLTSNGTGMIGGGRYLVVDETGGLLVAMMAERMGILYPNYKDVSIQPQKRDPCEGFSTTDMPTDAINQTTDSQPNAANQQETSSKHSAASHSASPAKRNTITVIHANTQPNLSLLKYFLFDHANPDPSHPLATHLQSLSWLQLLSPTDDTGYVEPEMVPNETLQTWKSSKRGNYYRKRRRWERIKSVVDETRAGGFDGLVVASVMNPATILHHVVPLLHGGASVVVYSPTIEPLAELADYYSTPRRTAFIASEPNRNMLPTDDFPLDPTLLLGPTIQTARARTWQVLPGRSHPHMTGRGGAEGYVFTGIRVLPVEGKVEARGNFKRRKTSGSTSKVVLEAEEDSPTVKAEESCNEH